MPAPDLTLNEYCDLEKVNRLLTHPDLNEGDKALLGAYKKTLKNGIATLPYHTSKRIKDEKQKGIIKEVYGRKYAQGISLAYLPKRIRNTLCNGVYYDIDFANSHLTILKQFLTKNGLIEKFPALVDYVDNRNDRLNDLMRIGWTRGEAKQLYLRLTYLGLKDAHCEEINADITTLPKHIGEYADEIQKASKWVSTNDFREKEVIGCIKDRNRVSNINYRVKASSYLSSLLGHIEDICLMSLKEYLELKGFEVCVLMYDGLMIKRGDHTEEEVELALDEAEEYMEERTSYRMALAIKPFEEGLDMERCGQSIEVIDWTEPENIDLGLTEDELAEWNPALAHKIQFSNLRDRYFKVKKYFEMFVCWCEDPATYLFTPYPNKSRQPLYRNKDQFKDLMTKMPKCSIQAAYGDQFHQCYMFDPNRKSFDKLEFSPYNKEQAPSGNIYNLWNGFAPSCYVSHNESERQLLCEPFYDLIRVMSGDDSKSFIYSKKWLASIIQYPSMKNCIAWVITGNQGTGKGTLIACLDALISKDYVLETDDVNYLFGTYAEGRMGRLVINANEVEMKGTAQYENRIKSAITDAENTINPKGVRTFTTKDYSRWIFTTNKPDPVPIDVKTKDRRFHITKSTTRYMSWSRQQWSDLRNHMKKPEVISAIYNDLMNEDIDTFDWVDGRPRTKAMEDLYDMNTPLELQWACDVFDNADEYNNATHRDYDDIVGRFVSTRLLYESFKKFCEKQGCHHVPSSNRFTGLLKHLDLPIIHTKSNGYRGFNISGVKCGEALRKKYPHCFPEEIIEYN